MEAVSVIGGAILSSLFQVLFDKLASHDFSNLPPRGDRDEGLLLATKLKNWERMLRSIYAVLDNAEEQQVTNHLVQHWVSDLRDLAYDVEDVLDDFSTAAAQLKVKPATCTTEVEAQNFFPIRRFIPAACFSCVNPKTMLTNPEMMSKMDEITGRLEEIVVQKNLLDLREGFRGRNNRVVDRPPTTSLVNEATVYGREKDQKAVVELLKCKAGGDAEICVISIIGMGGVGKTTLAQLIFNDPSLEFDLKAWVSVGETFSVVNMTKTILHSLDENSVTDDLNELQVKLKNKLSGKKFLVVLDDVWNENYEHWTLFRGPFEEGGTGSRIIVTTRNNSVSSMMGGFISAYPLKGLSYNDCLSVFAQHALGATNFNSHLHLKDVGESIVNRCQGLPLAAKAIGGILRGKPDLNWWEQVLNNEIWDIPVEKSHILPALQMSYYHLPSHLKRCFAYCAIFPKGFELNKTDLVLLWMSQGLLHQPRRTKQPKVVGQEYFQELFSRSFFLQSSGNKSTYVMHDLMNDLARSVSRDLCFHLDDNLENASLRIRHLSFSPQRYDIWQRFEVLLQMKSLRTFLALPDFSSRHVEEYYLTNKVLNDLIPKLKFLRVLSVSGYSFMELPSSIGTLKHLRYLDLSYTKIERLPESICQLINLQTLILTGCRRLIELPAGMGNLINLLHLDISETDNLQEMPLQIGNLRDLDTLSKFVVGEGNGVGIIELKKFLHLQGQLHITNLQNVVNVQDARLANLKGKQGLYKLVLEWAKNFDGSRNVKNELHVLNSLQPHQYLEELSVKFYGDMEFPPWLRDLSFEAIVFLELCNCPKISTLPPLWKLPFLTKLIIESMDEVKEVGVEFHGDDSSVVGFPCLETLIIENMMKWEVWSWCDASNEFAAGKFPKLREFTMKNCPKLIGKLPSYLPSLETLKIWRCPQLANIPTSLPSLRELDVGEFQKLLLRIVPDIASISILSIRRISGLKTLHDCLGASDKLSNLKRLTISDCEQLVSLVDGEEELLPCTLEDLNIYGCRKLEKLPKGLQNVTSLKSLSVRSCPKLASFPAAGLPCSLKSLVIGYCDSLETLPQGIMLDLNNTAQTSNLERLIIYGCAALTSFSGEFPKSVKTLSICCWTTHLLESIHEGLSHLILLDITECPELESFPANGLVIPTLIVLRIGWCKNLRCLPNHMDNLISLRDLRITECPGLTSFPAGGLPPNLKTLAIESCDNLSQPISRWGLQGLTSLTGLAIQGPCPSTDMVSFLGDDGPLLPTSLTFLCIQNFNNLKFVSRGLQKLTSLRTLVICECPELQFLPKEGVPASLGCLKVSSCPLLKKQYSKDTSLWPIISHIPCVEMESNEFTYFEE